MKILVANLGSTSLKWRLFDFSNGQERLVHKGGLERVSDYPKAIGECLEQLKAAGHIGDTYVEALLPPTPSETPR